jgi:predicted RecA/RadA family phage recombinase
MKNFIQPGETVSVITTSAIESGAALRIGVLFGVTATAALADEPVEISLCGVFELPKATGSSWDVGSAIFWNGTACTVTAGTGNLLIGVALSEQVSADVVGNVRLNGASPAALTS